jgi:hypothetical protein
LKPGALVARVRLVPEASFVPVGQGAITDPGMRGALQREVNNCTLAEQFLAAIRPQRP